MNCSPHWDSLKSFSIMVWHHCDICNATNSLLSSIFSDEIEEHVYVQVCSEVCERVY